MREPNHRITEVNVDEQTALCSICGLTPVEKYEKKWRCPYRAQKLREGAARRARKRYHANPEKARERNRRDWAQRDPEVKRAKASEYYKNNREAKNKVNREWKKRNPDRVAAWRARRKAVLSVDVDYGQVKREEGPNCYLCGLVCQLPTLDHLIPLSKDGIHAAFNLAVACRSCNSSKGNKLPFELPEDVRAKVIDKLVARRGPRDPEDF